MIGFIYYSVCQALALAGLLMAVLSARTSHDEMSRRYLAVFGGLALISMSMTFQMMFPKAADMPSFLTRLLSCSALLGVPVSIFTMPRFVRCIFRHRGQEALIRTATALSVTGLAILPSAFVMLPLWYQYGICCLHYLVLALCGLYVSVGIRIALARHRRGAQSLPPIWNDFLGAVFWIMVAVLPAALASDLLQFLDCLLKIDVPFLMPLFTASFSLAWFLSLLRNAKSSNQASVAERRQEAVSASAAYDWDRYAFSSREREVAELLLAGYPYQKIAESLFISPATVKSHVINVYQKAGVKNKLDLLHAVKRGS
jgi:DNA-binding CsgD family transcriptional regulator